MSDLLGPSREAWCRTCGQTVARFGILDSAQGLVAHRALQRNGTPQRLMYGHIFFDVYCGGGQVPPGAPYTEREPEPLPPQAPALYRDAPVPA